MTNFQPRAPQVHPLNATWTGVIDGPARVEANRETQLGDLAGWLIRLRTAFPARRLQFWTGQDAAPLGSSRDQFAPAHRASGPSGYARHGGGRDAVGSGFDNGGPGTLSARCSISRSDFQR